MYPPESQLRKAKILMIHGTGQSGSFFHSKTRFLREPLRDALKSSFPGGIEFDYPDGPVPTPKRADVFSSLENQDHGDSRYELDSYNWGYGDWEESTTVGVDDAIQHIIRLLESKGPYDGIIAFSAGAAISAMAAALLERDQKADPKFRQIQHPPLQFVVSFSGFKLRHPEYRWVYGPKIQTPILHFIGSLDTVVPNEDAVNLVKDCQDSEVMSFMGAHFVPRGRWVVEKVVCFAVKTLGWEDKGNHCIPV